MTALGNELPGNLQSLSGHGPPGTETQVDCASLQPHSSSSMSLQCNVPPLDTRGDIHEMFATSYASEQCSM